MKPQNTRLTPDLPAGGFIRRGHPMQVALPDVAANHPMQVTLPDVVATHAFAARVAERLRPGDLVILTGDLGAGKTTFVQGLGAALGVQGRISSPTFIIAREHPGPRRADGRAGPALIHVDAYRLGGLDELDALDLDSALEDAITVVEWGRGLVEQLAEDRLEIELTRTRGGSLRAAPPVGGFDPINGSISGRGQKGDDDQDPDDQERDADQDPDDDQERDDKQDLDEPRTATITGIGPRWAGVRF